MQPNRHCLVYTVSETGAMLGLSRSTAYDLVKSGDIASIRLGRRLYVTRLTLEEILGFYPPSPAQPSCTPESGYPSAHLNVE